MNNTEPSTNPGNITQSSTPDLSIPSANPEQTSSSYLFYFIALAALLIAIYILSKRKTKTNKKQIGIVGERGSGKTQLFLGLSGGKPFETVPSIANNTCQLPLGRNTYQLCDFIGDNLSKEEVITQIVRFHTLVHVIDGTDSKKLGDAALFIYRVLVNKQFQKEPCNYIVFLNKSDLKQFHGLEKLLKRIEDEIETIKGIRRNQVEENQQGEEDYLRNDRTLFDLKKQGIEVLVGSAQHNRTSLDSLLEDLCG